MEGLITLPGVGQAPQDEAPQVVNPLILDFVRRHSSGGSGGGGGHQRRRFCERWMMPAVGARFCHSVCAPEVTLPVGAYTLISLKRIPALGLHRTEAALRARPCRQQHFSLSRHRFVEGHAVGKAPAAVVRHTRLALAALRQGAGVEQAVYLPAGRGPRLLGPAASGSACGRADRGGTFARAPGVVKPGF